MISGAELEFGGGLGVAIFLCAYVCVYVCVGERETFCRQDDERGARLTGSKLDGVCCIGVDFFMPQRREY